MAAVAAGSTVMAAVTVAVVGSIATAAEAGSIDAIKNMALEEAGDAGQEEQPLLFFQAESDPDGTRVDEPFVVIARTREELEKWMGGDVLGALQWIQVEGLLSDADTWVSAVQQKSHVPLDVIVSDPGKEFSHIYRLVDLRIARDVRVSIPTTPGFMKAVKLACSIHVPVQLIPVQPDAESVDELKEALNFFLHDPMLETPIEFFHTTLAGMRESTPISLWRILGKDPAIFSHHDASGNPLLPLNEAKTFVQDHLAALIDGGKECQQCPWQELCQGYFKYPDPDYSCDNIVQIFEQLKAAADEIEQDLAAANF